MNFQMTLLVKTSFGIRIKNLIEEHCKGKCAMSYDNVNDRLVIRIDTRSHGHYTYIVYNFSGQLYNGITSEQIAHNFIESYSQKIFKIYFK